MTISPGALNPNLSTPITLEAYLYHMADTPASMAILFVQGWQYRLLVFSR